MVLKKGKRGVRTGGTIRGHPNRRGDDCKKIATVFRPDINREKSSALNLPENFESNIQYSLNKRERWNLPSVIFGQVHRLAIEDHAATAGDDGDSNKQVAQRNSVVMVQYPGYDNVTPSARPNKNKSNYVIYYGERYPVPVERISYKAKLDPLNVVAQLDDGTFFKHSSDDKKGCRRRCLVETSTGGSEECNNNSGGEQFCVYLADKKYINKKQALKQPRKIVAKNLSGWSTGGYMLTSSSSSSDAKHRPHAVGGQPRHYIKLDDDDYYYSSSDEEEERQNNNNNACLVSSPPPHATFKLSDFL